MTQTPAQQQAVGGPARHLLLYDGVCGLCNHWLQFVLRHDRRRLFNFAALQSATGRRIVTRCGANPAQLISVYVIAEYHTDDPRVLTRSDAVLFVAAALGWPWQLLRVARLLPKSLRDSAYNLIARHRYQLFGRDDRCLLPRPEFRDRFVE